MPIQKNYIKPPPKSHSQFAFLAWVLPWTNGIYVPLFAYFHSGQAHVLFWTHTSLFLTSYFSKEVSVNTILIHQFAST